MNSIWLYIDISVIALLNRIKRARTYIITTPILEKFFECVLYCMWQNSAQVKTKQFSSSFFCCVQRAKKCRFQFEHNSISTIRIYVLHPHQKLCVSKEHKRLCMQKTSPFNYYVYAVPFVCGFFCCLFVAARFRSLLDFDNRFYASETSHMQCINWFCPTSPLHSLSLSLSHLYVPRLHFHPALTEAFMMAVCMRMASFNFSMSIFYWYLSNLLGSLL